MYSHDNIKRHAEKAADDRREKSACPYDLDSPMGQLWLDAYISRIVSESGDLKP